MPECRREHTCCFTGHRDISEAACPDIEERISFAVRRMLEKGVTCFCFGGAVGFDTLAAECVLRMRDEGLAAVSAVLIVPYDGYHEARDRSPQERARYLGLLPRFDAVLSTRPSPSRWMFWERDRDLVDRSAYCIAYLTRPDSGTGYTVRYAEKKGLSVINIAGERYPCIPGARGS